MSSFNNPTQHHQYPVEKNKWIDMPSRLLCFCKDSVLFVAVSPSYLFCIGQSFEVTSITSCNVIWDSFDVLDSEEVDGEVCELDPRPA